MKITVFEGNFNPPHIGHIRVAKELAEECDELLVVPRNIESEADRISLCNLAFSEIENAKISDMEINREGKSYIADTIDFLKEQYPDAELCLAVGNDVVLDDWWRIDYIRDNCSIYAFSHDEESISGELIREKLRLRLGSEYLTDSVYGQIIKNGWYDALPDLSWLREKIIDYLDSKRIAHVAGCEQEAVKLANYWGEDEDLAATAGILHDITKRCSYEEQLDLIRQYNIVCTEGELGTPKLLHAITGAALAKDLFGISNEVYSAIRYHTTAKPDMTLLEKIIYLADYIEPTRDFDGVDKLRELAYKDLNRCMELGLEMSLKEIQDKGNEPYIDTKEAYEYYVTAE